MSNPPALPDSPPAPEPRIAQLPALPVVVAGLAGAAWMSADGDLEEITLEDAARRCGAEPVLLCHAPATARRLGCNNVPGAFDLLELFAFVRPAAFCAPTPHGLATALGMAVPRDAEAAVASLYHAALQLLGELAARAREEEAIGIAWTLAECGWPWGGPVLQALGFTSGRGAAPRFGQGLKIWERLDEWEDPPPQPPPGLVPVDAAAARQRLAELLGDDAEARPQQADYASAVSQALAPRAAEHEPNLVLAEAGTGVGKTLGYLAPASLWAESNEAPIWISTFTRNLQHQIDRELDRLYPEPEQKRRNVVIRKGRENYLCLLNYQDAVRALPTAPHDAVAVGLMARWAARSRDGDMVGGDFPGWLPGLVGRQRTLGLTDRRGECIHSACDHYRKCFIERSLRHAKQARIVVANHALVMIQAAMGGGDDSLPPHYVFDEGHHVFDAADNAFAAHLSGQETQELRRWLIGGEGQRRGAGRGADRIRGLQRRLEDLVRDDETCQDALAGVLKAARMLASEGWRQRIEEARPLGPVEQFLTKVRSQVYARIGSSRSPYSLEVEPHPLDPDLAESAAELERALGRLETPLRQLRTALSQRLEEETDSLDSDSRRRLDAAARSLEFRAENQVKAWRNMLRSLETETPPEFCDWLAVERLDGRDFDVGLYRHWVDPTAPFAESLLSETQGALITSATLTDGSDNVEADWQAAEQRTGAVHLPNPAIRTQLRSPFDYAVQTRVLLVNDVRKDDLDQVAAAYRSLFLASGGGALGLFTAIARLRAVHEKTGRALEAVGLPLYAQHVDGLDVSTLVEIFRDDVDSSLLGTDAVRDGVDVPGHALRLIVFDRVPWPRPDIRHKARRAVFGKRDYDDRLARLKLRQAFGRLIRRRDDRGVFVLLDPMMPSRLAGAFPEDVTVERLGIAEAVTITREFFEP